MFNKPRTPHFRKRFRGLAGIAIAALLGSALAVDDTTAASTGMAIPADALVVQDPIDPSQFPDPGSIDPDPFGASPALEAQAASQELSDQINILVAEQELPGFLGTKVSADTLDLYWKGDPPSQVASLIEDSPVTVRIHAAAFDAAELDRAARHLLDNATEIFGRQPVRAGLSTDFSSITVTFEAGQLHTLGSEPQTEPLFDIPLEYAEGAAPEPAQTDWRWGDLPPFFGGGAIYRPASPDEGGEGSVYCTTAFTVTRNFNGDDGVLTAAHCEPPDELGVWRSPAYHVFVGSFATFSTARDSMVLTGGLGYDPEVWVGAYNGGSHLGVAAAANPGVNTLVYPQGSWSGGSEVRVIETNQYWLVGGNTFGPGFVTENEDGNPSVGQGDSGGPVVTPVTGSATVTARGLISAIVVSGIDDDCQGLTAEFRTCGLEAFHINIAQIAATHNVTIQTE